MGFREKLDNSLKNIKEKPDKVIYLAIGVAIFIILAVVTGVNNGQYDLALNKALYNPNSPLGWFFQNFGDFPPYVSAQIIFTITFFAADGIKPIAKGGKKAILAARIISAALVYVGYFVMLRMWLLSNLAPDLGSGVKYGIALAVAAPLAAATLFFASKIDKGLMKKLLPFALFLLIVFAVTNGPIHLLKEIWLRQRFRTMTPENGSFAGILAAYDTHNFEGFTPWYIPNLLVKNPLRTLGYTESVLGIDHDAFKSFPSGHTSGAAMTMALFFIPYLFKDNEKVQKNKVWFYAVPIAYTCLVAVFRIVYGAHFLSDVTFGGFISILLVVIAKRIFIRLREKIIAEDNADEAPVNTGSGAETKK
ncbi:MAG: phosphatase PAP2 family protein [Christensenellaceae bacterium]|jgi:membrane-associated phospholipid phosphatase|nr:phosphatase PAP2 family protein [Christensenellaceae bacterium]